MKALLLSIFYTLVIVLLGSAFNYALAKDIQCGEETCDDEYQRCITKGKHTIPGNPPIIIEAHKTCVKDEKLADKRQTDKEAKKDCSAAWKAWGEEVEHNKKSMDDKSERLSDKLSKAQEDFSKHEKNGKKSLQEIEKEIADRQKDYEKSKAETEQKNQENKLKSDQQMRAKLRQVKDLSLNRELMNQSIGIARRNIELAQNEPLDFIYFKCQNEIRGLNKSNHSITTNGFSGAGGKAKVLDDLLAACIQKETRPKQAAIDDMNIELEKRKSAMKMLESDLQDTQKEYNDLAILNPKIDYQLQQQAAKEEQDNANQINLLRKKYLETAQSTSADMQREKNKSAKIQGDLSMTAFSKSSKKLDTLAKEVVEVGPTCCNPVLDGEDVSEDDEPETDKDGKPIKKVRACPTNPKSGDSSDWTQFFMNQAVQQMGGAQ